MRRFLSPHFDDAVLSCGGTIHQLATNRQVVQTLTQMADKPAHVPNTLVVLQLHARWRTGDDPVTVRREEDMRAAARLGAHAKHAVGTPDCIYRIVPGTDEACYPTLEAVFGEIHPADEAVRQLNDPSILLLDDAPDVIYAPLGAGHHVDHQIVRNQAIALKRQSNSLAIKFYEEYPYIRDIMAAQRA